jgi:hypothetical protein
VSVVVLEKFREGELVVEDPKVCVCGELGTAAGCPDTEADEVGCCWGMLPVVIVLVLFPLALLF